MGVSGGPKGINEHGRTVCSIASGSAKLPKEITRYETHRDGRKAVTNSRKSGKLVVEFFKRVHVICLQLDLASGASPFPSQNLGTSINLIGANGTSALCFLKEQELGSNFMNGVSVGAALELPSTR
ncbi:hypothetical protein Nepgr_010479 [Nepenthes gracilis]|uniref:Uncharacterized protein n=1 Tax=Nepenthes gracilis TaxID=150966 RepID=A0AAD3XLD6_NEPGR|nr:hypothetical protein Nepgr_010479 [Nepenthes gracilis]